MGTYQTGVADELAGEPQEWLLEVVVGLGGDIVVLEVLLAVEGDSLGLDFSLLDVDLVTTEDDGDTLADTDKITYFRQYPSRNKERKRTYGASWERSCR